MDRFPPIPPEDLNRDQEILLREYADTWRGKLATPGGTLGGAFDVTLRSPQLARALMPVADYFRGMSSIAPRAKELVVLMVASRRRCAYEWRQHVGPAMKAGWSQRDVAAIASGLEPALTDEDRFTYAVVDDLLRSGRVGDLAFSEAAAGLGYERLVDTIGLVSYYWLLASFINASVPDSASEADADLELPPGPGPGNSTALFLHTRCLRTPAHNGRSLPARRGPRSLCRGPASPFRREHGVFEPFRCGVTSGVAVSASQARIWRTIRRRIFWRLLFTSGPRRIRRMCTAFASESVSARRTS